MTPDVCQETLELVVLCGFLGSGKTTLLLEHLRDSRTGDTLVIVNEAGQIDIDGAILTVGSGRAALTLSNGCVCCSMVDDLSATILEQLQARRNDGLTPMRRIIIECSGMSRPSPIIRSLGRLPIARLAIRVVTTFDAATGARSAVQHDEALAQLAAAQTVVLTKLDRVDEVQRRAARASVRGVNPLAIVVDSTDPVERAWSALAGSDTSPLRTLEDPAMQVLNRAFSFSHTKVKTMLVRFDEEIGWDELAIWLDDLAGLCGERLLRLKGILKLNDWPDPVLVQSVGTAFSAPRRTPSASSGTHGLVVITNGIKLADVLALNPRLTRDVRYAHGAKVSAESEASSPALLQKLD